MRSLVTVLVTLLVLAGGQTVRAQDPTYGWTVSADSQDPFANEGLWIPGLLTLHLWFACNANDGMYAAEIGLRCSNPANAILAFTPASGFLNAGNSTDLLLVVAGCPNAPLRAGEILLLSNAPGQVCLAPGAFYGELETIDCSSTPQGWPIEWIGFSDEGTAPCSMDWAFCMGSIGVEGRSWGSVKGFYR